MSSSNQGPDYEDSDEEEQKARMNNLLQEWKSACQARLQRKNEEQELWSSPARGKPYQEEYENYPGRGKNVVDTQRFPTGYSPCPPNSTISIHLQNSFRMNSSFVDQSRMQPRIPIAGTYHPFQPPPETYSNCEDPTGHPLSTSDPPNPLRTSYSQVLLRQSSINSQFQYYPENQRLYPESIRQFPDFPRPYPDQRTFAMPRTIPTVNILHDHRFYPQDLNVRPFLIYQDEPRLEEPRAAMDPRTFHDPQRPDIRPAFDNQRNYERLNEKVGQFVELREAEGPRMPVKLRPQLMTQRSMQDPQRVYRNVNNEDHSFRQDRFSEPSQDSSSRIPNPNYKRSLSVDVQYVAGPPPPREMIPLQGAPGPPQGSPRPLVARGLQTNMHRLPANSVVQFRKPQGAFT